MAHELTHATADPYGPPEDRLDWADEGYADFVGNKELGHDGYFLTAASVARKFVHSKSWKGTLPSNDTFYRKNVNANYAVSERFFEYVAKTYGTSKTTKFYIALKTSPDQDVNAAAHKVLKVSEKSLMSAWASWMKRQ